MTKSAISCTGPPFHEGHGWRSSCCWSATHVSGVRPGDAKPSDRCSRRSGTVLADVPAASHPRPTEPLSDLCPATRCSHLGQRLSIAADARERSAQQQQRSLHRSCGTTTCAASCAAWAQSVPPTPRGQIAQPSSARGNADRIVGQMMPTVPVPRCVWRRTTTTATDFQRARRRRPHLDLRAEQPLLARSRAALGSARQDRRLRSRRLHYA